MKKENEREERSIVYCPRCKHRTFTTIRYGEIGVRCKFCKHVFEVIIRSPEFIPEEMDSAE